MLIVRKNQLFDQEWQVCQYINGEFVGVVSGLGCNAGTWDSAAKSKRTAQRWAKQCRRDDPKSTHRVETVN
jgi:hypothetical protein